MRVQALLDRFGLATRGGAASAGIPGGFSAAYRILLEMESRGRVQRVYAVQGLGGSQFALPGVVDRLREVERDVFDTSERSAGTGPPPEAIVLAATDPANPFGTVLPWPPTALSSAGADRATEGAEGIESGEPPRGAVAGQRTGMTSSHRPSRSAGCHIVLCCGMPVLFVERGGHSLVSFAADDPAPVRATGSGDEGRSPVEGRSPADRAEQVLASATAALRSAITLGRVSEVMITRIDGDAALGHLDKPLGRALVAAGATVTPRGFRMRARP